MYYTTSRLPQSSSNNRRQGAALQRVYQVSDKDGEKLSPVDLSLRDAVPVQLAPLRWTHYHDTPAALTVRNTGFTLMINASFERECPYVSSGPLMGDYVFAQIHFHWGEHDHTGSAHAVDGHRYPLEMHVVHLKKDCKTLGEAFSQKDGVAVMVHLFALREERNTQLDQLTATLQFLQRPRSCARLYPSPLAETVQPFTSDYFLYWGAVGSPRGQCRILWLLSRNVLPVSAQQMGEFRQLCDSQGKVLLSNTSQPYPLANRSLFLVGSSERTSEAMCGATPREQHHVTPAASPDPINIRNAEYRSLADLEEVYGETDDTDDAEERYDRQCRVCPLPRRRQQTDINVGYPSKVNEGDTSVEESCIDLDSDSRVTVKTETKYKESTRGQKVITNVNVTTFRPQKCRMEPQDAVYSVVSTRGSEIYLRRQSTIVRASDPSTEQACMLLSRRSSTRPTYSAPSLTSTGGPLTLKQECTDVSSRPIRHMSSEIAVHCRDSEILESRGRNSKVNTFDGRAQNTMYDRRYYEEMTSEEVLNKTKNVTRVLIQAPKLPDSSRDGKNNTAVTKNTDTMSAKPFAKNNVNEFLLGEENSKYLYTEQKSNFYNKVNATNLDTSSNRIGVNRLENSNLFNPTDNRERYMDRSDRKNTVDKTYDCNSKLHGSMISGTMRKGEETAVGYAKGNIKQTEFLEESSEEEYFSSTKHRENSQKRVIFRDKNDIEKSPVRIPFHENKENDQRFYKPPKKENENRVNKTDKSSENHYKVSLVVRTTISDHKNSGKKGKQFYVTKISPVEKSKYITPQNSSANVGTCYENQHSKQYYYAKPLRDDEQIYLEEDDEYNNQGLRKEEDYTVDELYKNKSEEWKEERRIKTATVGRKTTSKEEINTTRLTPQPPNNTKIPQTTRQSKNESGLYAYDEEYVTNEEQTSENETMYKIKKTTQRVQPLKLNDKEDKTQHVISEVEPENKRLQYNKGGMLVKTHENTANKNSLIEKVEIYENENKSEENIRIVDKTVVGKIGEHQSTDVLVNRKTTEVVKPQKNEVSEQVNYNIVTSKHPAPQHYTKEPMSKSQPKTVITQRLSLDQQTKGYSRVRQTVEYRDERKQKKTDPQKIKTEPVKQSISEVGNTLNSVTEACEEQSTEEMSKSNKSYHTLVKKVQSCRAIENQNNSLVVNQDNEIETNDKQQTHGESRIDQTIDRNVDNGAIVVEELIDEKSSRIIMSHHHNHKEIHSSVKEKEDKRHESKDNIIPERPGKLEKENSKGEKTTPDTIKQVVVTKPNPIKVSNSSNAKPELTTSKTDSKQLSGTLNAGNKSYNEEKKKECETKPIGILRNSTTSKDIKYVEPKTENLLEEQTNFEETTEQCLSNYESKKTTKTTTVQRKGETSYKLPATQTSIQATMPESCHTLTTTKVQMPEPHYITRIPKQPLVEYEAYPVDPQQPFEIITETSEEVSSTVRTNKTFMMFKRINGKAILNQPSVIEPMKIEKNQYSDPANSDSFSKNQVKPSETDKPLKVEQPMQKITNSCQTNNLPKQVSCTTNYSVKEVPNELEISETNVISNKKYVRKEKRYKLNILQSNDGEDDSLKISLSSVKRQPLTSIEETSKSDVKAMVQNSLDNKTSNIKNHQTDVRSFNQKSDTDKRDPRNQNKTAVDSYQTQASINQKLDSVGNQAGELVVMANEESKVPTKITAKPNPPDRRREQFTNEEYYETTTIEEKYRSNKTRYISKRGNIRIINSRLTDMEDQFPSERQGTRNIENLKYPEDEPTRDSAVQDKKFGRCQDRIGHARDSSNSKLDNSRVEHSRPHEQRGSENMSYSQARTIPIMSDPNNVMNSSQMSKTDGDIVIFIRQPKSNKDQVKPKITVDVTEKQSMTSSDLDAQKVQIHELKTNTGNHKTSKNTMQPRKSKSAGNYHLSTSSGSSEEDGSKNMSSDSNEEQFVDTTHYNLTLKSETQVEIEGGRSGVVKSKAEVRIDPLGTPVRRAKNVARQAAAAEDDDDDKDRDGEDSSDSMSSFEEPAANSIPDFNQSPIRINTQASKVRNYPTLQLFHHWDVVGNALLENNGKTLRGTYVEESSVPYIQGGPLSGVYVFAELHFHWGYKDCCGGEHIIDGKRHALEAHFLYFKKGYGLIKEALSHHDGIAVIAVNLTVGGPPNPQLGELIKDIGLLREPETGAYVPARALFSWAQPAVQGAAGYYSYKGSLSAEPPHVESVTWIIFPEPIVFCCQQSREFRKLKSSKGAFLTKNFRAPQPLNNRSVYFVPL